jgi:hypothetical protein
MPTSTTAKHAVTLFTTTLLIMHYIPIHQSLVNLWFKNESISPEQQSSISSSFNIHDTCSWKMTTKSNPRDKSVLLWLVADVSSLNGRQEPDPELMPLYSNINVKYKTQTPIQFIHNRRYSKIFETFNYSHSRATRAYHRLQPLLFWCCFSHYTQHVLNQMVSTAVSDSANQWYMATVFIVLQNEWDPPHDGNFTLMMAYLYVV